MKDEEDFLLEMLREKWRNGGSAFPLIEKLIARQQMDEAAAIARVSLAVDGCQDREEIEALLERTGCPPSRWGDAIIAFSQQPSLAAWDELMSFTPDDVLYHRIRNTLRMLRKIGTDSNILFHCATRTGIIPDAFDLVQSGEVDPETVIARAEDSPPEFRSTWIGLAAEAAFFRGDEVEAVRLLKEACCCASEYLDPEISIKTIRSNASEELKEILDNDDMLKMFR